jgi:hypothetical protein
MGRYEQEILLPPSAADHLLRVSVHEAAHAVVGHHFGAGVAGIAFASDPAGLIAMALYRVPNDLLPEDRRTIFAAGPAGEMLEFGNYDPLGASRDRRDAETVPGELSFEELVIKAENILLGRRLAFDRIASALRERIFNSSGHITMEVLPNGVVGALVLNQIDLWQLVNAQ